MKSFWLHAVWIVWVIIGTSGCGEDTSFGCENAQVQESIKQMLSIELQDLAQYDTIKLFDIQTLDTNENLLQCQAMIEGNTPQITALNPLHYEVTKDLRATLIFTLPQE
ncbi:hypothetical protein [Helicobacter equorum]|uniref:hypothetical protein n=1 Tax=Helicobacter equorum TaxID=361872 RepID=UPI000CF0F913|nr:hypothetical protein [Helicobacter equorum]